MSRRVAIAACLLALAAPAAAGAAPAAETAPARLLVTGREYSLTLSRPKLPAGKAIVQLYNYGEDTHDLNLQRNGSDRIYEIGDVEPGQTGAVELRLRRRSSYRLWCAIDPHASLGMVATLQTKAKRPRRHR
ncbi:MAG TPA: hypothetical protein VFS73_04645 [Solirubrobacterales bacterium]|jgi:hypothetical protein|nr:hypothetical protein [Solirubrobacterales bacterium]